MKAIDLHKFVNENNIEYHKGGYYIPTIYMFVPISLISDFNKLLGVSIFDDEGISPFKKELSQIIYRKF